MIFLCEVMRNINNPLDIDILRAIIWLVRWDALIVNSSKRAANIKITQFNALNFYLCATVICTKQLKMFLSHLHTHCKYAVNTHEAHRTDGRVNCYDILQCFKKENKTSASHFTDMCKWFMDKQMRRTENKCCQPELNLNDCWSMSH